MIGQTGAEVTLAAAAPIVAGIIAGLIINWLADTLPAQDGPSGARWLQVQPGRRWLWVELTTVALFIYAAGVPLYRGDDTLDHVLRYVYLAVFMLILVIDVEHRRVPNQVLAPVLAMGLLHALAQSPTTLGNVMLGGAVGFLIFLVIGLGRRGGMGAGDIKLAGVMGAVVGFPHILAALVLGILAGGIGALVLLLSRRVKRQDTMPYAPYLAIGTWITLLHGNDVLRLFFDYLR